MAKSKDKSGTNLTIEPELPKTDLSEKFLVLKEKLTKDLATIDMQLQGIDRKQEEVQTAQQSLMKQKIALEALANYLRPLLS